LALGGVLAWPPTAALAQPVETRLELDTDRIGASSIKMEWMTLVSEGLGKALTVRYLVLSGDPDTPVALVLFSYRVSRGRVVARDQSAAFTVRPGTAALLGADLTEGEQVYDGSPRAGLADFIVARKAVSAESGLREPERHVINGIFVKKPSDWERRDALYLIAVPADARLRSESRAYPMVVFLR
jgi:hypothetical protein